MSTRPAPTRRHLPRSPFNQTTVAAEPVPYVVDDRVSHDRHGLGRVVKSEAETVVVDFGEGKVVRVLRTSERLTQL